MHRSNERSEMASNRSQHELDHVLDHDTENTTLKAQLDSLDRQLTYYHKLCREQEATIKDLRSQLDAAKAEDVARRDERDTQMSDAAAPRDTPLDLPGETDTAKARSRKRYRAPTVESVSDEGFGNTAPREQQQASTNHVLEVFLTFVSVTDSRTNERQAVYVRQQQSLRDVLGAQMFGRFATDAMAFVYKAQRIRDVGQTAAQVSRLPTHAIQQTSQLTHVPEMMQLCLKTDRKCLWPGLRMWGC